MRLAAFSCVVTVAAVAARPSHACDCGDLPAVLVSPRDLDGAPLNTVFMARVPINTGAGLAVIELVLFDAAGVEVSGVRSTVISELEVEALSTFTPDEPLAPTAQYRVAVRSSDVFGEAEIYLDEEGNGGITVTTGTADIVENPPIPDVGFEEPVAFHSGDLDSCPGWNVFFSTVRDDGDNIVVLVDRDETTTFDPSLLSGTVQTLFPSGDQHLIGIGVCLRTWEAFFGSTASFRVGALSTTGVFSGWSEPRTVTMPNDSDCDGLPDTTDACPLEPGYIGLEPGLDPDATGCPEDGPADRPWCDVAEGEGEGEGEGEDIAEGEGEGEPPGEGEGEADGNDDSDEADDDGCATTEASSTSLIAILLCAWRASDRRRTRIRRNMSRSRQPATRDQR